MVSPSEYSPSSQMHFSILLCHASIVLCTAGRILLGCPSAPSLRPLDGLHAFKMGHFDDPLEFVEKKKDTQSKIR